MSRQPDWIPISKLAKEYDISADVARRWFHRRGWVHHGVLPGQTRKRVYCSPGHAEEFRACYTGDMSNYVTAQELADECGVTVRTVCKWVEKLPKRKGRTPRPKIRRRQLCIPLELATQYKEGRSHYKSVQPQRVKRPKGWVTVYSLRSEVSKGWLYAFIRRANIETVSDSGAFYVSPEDAERIRLTYRSSLPLPGWVQATEAARELGVTVKTVRRRFEERGYPLRKYRNSHAHFVWHVLERDLEQYRAAEGRWAA